MIFRLQSCFFKSVIVYSSCSGGKSQKETKQLINNNEPLTRLYCFKICWRKSHLSFIIHYANYATHFDVLLKPKGFQPTNREHRMHWCVCHHAKSLNEINKSAIVYGWIQSFTHTIAGNVSSSVNVAIPDLALSHFTSVNWAVGFDNNCYFWYKWSIWSIWSLWWLFRSCLHTDIPVRWIVQSLPSFGLFSP